MLELSERTLFRAKPEINNILIKITNSKYIDKKIKNQLIAECNNNEIISILESKKITAEKKNKLIILLQNLINNNSINKNPTTDVKFNDNLFLIFPSNQ